MKKGQERVYRKKGFTLYHQNFPKKSLGRHSHHESHLMIPLEGSVELGIDGVFHQVKAGQMLFVGGDVEHDFRATGEMGERLILQVDLKTKSLKTRVSLMPTHQLVKTLTLDLFTYENEKFAESIEGLIKEVIVSLLAQQSSATNELFQVQAKLLKSSNPQFRKILTVLEGNLEANMTEVSAESGLSPRSLSRLVQSEVGLSPNELLTYFRIQRACELIYAQDLNLTAIAFECGHSSLSQFITNFKKWTGAKPSEFG